MARENTVFFHGQLRDKPKIVVSKDGETMRVMFPIRVLRRPTTQVELQGNQLRIDTPVIMTKNPDLAKIASTFACGDMIDFKGVVSSKEVLKKTRCPECNTENAIQGNILYFTPIYLCKREHATEEEGLQFLKERSEISNVVEVIGNLCRDPQFYQDEKGRSYAQYQIAVNRRYHIREDADDLKTDYPWVKTFGPQACEDSRCLKTGSTIKITAGVQTRVIERQTVCEKCGAKYTWNESVAELVPYYIGYIANCDVPEKKDEGES